MFEIHFTLVVMVKTAMKNITGAPCRPSPSSPEKELSTVNSRDLHQVRSDWAGRTSRAPGLAQADGTGLHTPRSFSFEESWDRHRLPHVLPVLGSCTVPGL